MSNKRSNRYNSVQAETLPDIIRNSRSSFSRISRQKFGAAFAAKKHRMYAPFLTQLTKQYDPVEVQSVEREERRAQAEVSYRHSYTPYAVVNKKDIKI